MKDIEVLRELLNTSDLGLELIRYLPFPLFIKDSNGNYLYKNQKLLSEINKDLRELIERDDTDGVTSDVQLKWLKDDLDVLYSQKSIQKEFKIGNRIYKVIKFNFVSEKGKAYLAGYAIDVTEYQNALSRLSIFKRVVESMNDSLVVSLNDPDRDFPILFVNPAFTKLTGYTTEDVVGKNCRFLQGVHTDLNSKEEIKKAIRNGATFNGTLLNYKKDGTPFYNELKILPVYNSTNKTIPYFMGIQRDVTKITNTQKALAESENRYTNIFNNTYSAIILVDSEGRIIEVNNKGVSLAAVSRETLLGTYLWHAYWWDIPEEESKRLEYNFKHEVIEERLSKKLEIGIKSDAKTYIYEITLKPITAENGLVDYVICEGRDITVNKLHEKEIESQAKLGKAFEKELADDQDYKYLSQEELNLLVQKTIAKKVWNISKVLPWKNIITWVLILLSGIGLGNAQKILPFIINKEKAVEEYIIDNVITPDEEDASTEEQTSTGQQR